MRACGGPLGRAREGEREKGGWGKEIGWVSLRVPWRKKWSNKGIKCKNVQINALVVCAVWRREPGKARDGAGGGRGNKRRGTALVGTHTSEREGE